MPSTARQLRQPPTIEAIERVLYFADIRYRECTNTYDTKDYPKDKGARYINYGKEYRV